MIGRAFKDSGYLWLVINKSRYAGYFDCINTDGDRAQYNERFIVQICGK